MLILYNIYISLNINTAVYSADVSSNTNTLSLTILRGSDNSQIYSDSIANGAVQQQITTITENNRLLSLTSPLYIAESFLLPNAS